MPNNKTVITFITGTVCFLAVVTVITYCILAFSGVEPSQGFSLLTGGLVGSLTSMLVKTTPTETTKQPPEPPPDDAPSQVEVVNPPANPVPTVDVK